MKPIRNIMLATAIACASQTALAQIKPVRVCTTEVNLYLQQDHNPLAPLPVQMTPLSLPPDFSVKGAAPGTVVVAVPVAWTQEKFEARLQQEECDFIVLTWWERGEFNADSIEQPMLNDDINPAWSMRMEAAPEDSRIVPSTERKWIRHFELDTPGFQRVLTKRGYPYSAPPEKKLTEIAKQMGTEILHVIDTRPRIEDLPRAAEPSKLLPLTAAPAPPQPDDSAATTGDSRRVKLTLPKDTPQGPPRVVANGHTCTPGDPSVVCKNICGGAFGPCKDVEQKLRLQEEHFVLARRLLVEKGVPFEPFTLLQSGGLERLKPVLDRMPEMREIRREASPSGVILADTLYLPEGARFGSGPTVVIVNHIVYEGACPAWISAPGANVWGTNGLYLFERGEPRVLGTNLDAALQQGGVTSYGERNPPPFSVIKDLDIPKSCRIHFGADGSGHK